MEKPAPSSESLEVGESRPHSASVALSNAADGPYRQPSAAAKSWLPTSTISPSPKSVIVLNDDEDFAFDEGVGTVGAAVMQVMLTCLGIAALCIPYLFAQVGWGLGTAILVIPAFVSCVSMRQIVILGDLTKKNTMAGAFTPYLGNKVGLLLSFVLFLLFEFIVAACMAIPCDIIPSLVPGSGVDSFVVGVGTILLAACCGFVKDLSGLDTILKPSILLVILLMIYVVGKASFSGVGYEMEFAILDRPQFSKPLHLRVFDTLSTAWTAFGAECAILAIYCNTAPKFRTNTKPVPFLVKVIDLPMLCLLVIYFIFGFAGYSQYGAEVEPNLLMTMGNEKIAIVAKIGLSFVNAARVPLFNVVQWYTLLELCPFVGRFEASGFGAVRCICISMMNVISLALLLALADFGKVMGFLGGVLGIPIFTLLPGLAWLSARYYPTATPRLHAKSCMYIAIDFMSVFLVCVMSVFYVANLASYF